MATLFNTKIKDTYQSLLKLEDNTILTTTVKNVTDGLGNASPLYMSTTRIGIGTNNPTTNLTIYGGADTLGITGAVNQAKSIQIARYNSSDPLCHYIGDDGGGFFGNGLTVSSSGSNSQIYLQVASSGRNVNIGSAGQTLLSKDMGARLGVRGSGSTSATTSLLVQNSGGTAALTVRDDLYVFGGSRVYSTGNMYMDGNTGTLFSAWGQLQLQGASYVQIMNDTLRAGSQNFTFQNTSFSPNAATNSNLRLVGNSAGFTNAGAGGTSIGNALEIPIGIATSIGNVTLNHIHINGVVNTTAGTTVQRGFYYNPTLTSTVGFTHNAIETVTGNVLLGTTSGNVGIGTSSPATEVHIKQVDSNASLLRLESASSVASNTYQVGVDFYSRITGAGGTDSFPVGKMYATGGGEFRSGKLRFQTIITNGGSLTDTMTLYQGNVAIGSLNTTPSKLLEITGLKDTIVADFSSNTVGVNEGISIQLSAAAGAYPLGVIKGIFTANSGYSALTFSTSTLNTPTEAMRITSGQNVLIGTTTDAGYKLDVNGSTRVKGNSLTLSASGLSSPPANYVGINFDDSSNHHQNWFAINSKADPGSGITTGYNRIIFPTMGASNPATWNFNALGAASAIQLSAVNSTTGNYLTLSDSSISFVGVWNVVSIDRTNRKLVFGNMVTDVNHLAVYDVVIKGAKPNEGNYGGAASNGGNVYVVGGTPATSPTGNYGNVILAHDGTAIRGNVGIGTNAPTATTHIKGAGSTSATSSLLVQNSSSTRSLEITDDGNAFIGGNTLQFSNSGNCKIINNFGTMQLDNNGTAGVSLSFTNGAWGSSSRACFGDQGTGAVASAQVEIKTTTRGFLPPRMTNAQKLAINLPAAGLQVYDTTLNQMSYFNGTTWVNF